ncbi:MAG: DUF4056 domain-containing protein [Planctomycetota bacterium]
MVKTIQKKTAWIYLFTLLALALILSGCQFGSRPRLRRSDYFGAPGESRFPDADDLGPHSLDACRDEKVGLVYTCKGGFIDLGHLREAADRTHYAAGILYQNLLRSKTSCSYRIIEPSRYYLKIHYPDNWKSLPHKRRCAIAREISIPYGQYLAHTSLIWHEIVTWYGYSSVGIFPESISAFSWEDPFSDVLGTHLAVKALGNQNKPYEEVMADLIDKALQQLDVQPADTARKATHNIRDEWFEGGYYFFVKMKKRNFDVGLDDGIVTPWLVPGICPDSVPKSCPAPRPKSVLDKYGFKIRLEIEPKVFEKKKIYEALKLSASERVDPSIHFPEIIEEIRKEARRVQGIYMDVSPQKKQLSKQNRKTAKTRM